jgi:hypothetical protein
VVDGEEDRDQQDGERQGEEPTVPEIARLPQGGEADSDQQEDDQQAGDGEPDATHRSIPQGVEATACDNLNPDLVKFQFQMSAIKVGLVAADYFLRHPGRFYSMHLQDVDMNVPPDAKRPQVPLGQGSIDWVKTFEAAKAGGVENYFVEQSWELTQQSVAYLKTLAM